MMDPIDMMSHDAMQVMQRSGARTWERGRLARQGYQ